MEKYQAQNKKLPNKGNCCPTPFFKNYKQNPSSYKAI